MKTKLPHARLFLTINLAAALVGAIAETTLALPLENRMAQVTSVSQLSGVQPTD